MFCLPATGRSSSLLYRVNNEIMPCYFSILTSNALVLCFLTFWAPSPGRRQSFSLLSRSLSSLGFCPVFSSKILRTCSFGLN
jgi:hypothetical protein